MDHHRGRPCLHHDLTAPGVLGEDPRPCASLPELLVRRGRGAKSGSTGRTSVIPWRSDVLVLRDSFCRGSLLWCGGN
jgi:hypothetical protein